MGPQAFGARIKWLRRQAGLTLRELALRTGVSFTYLSKIESGAVPPPSEKVISQLARTLNADSDELIILSGKIPPDITRILQKDPKTAKRLRLAYNQKKDRASSRRKREMYIKKSIKKLKGLTKLAAPAILSMAVAASLWFVSPTPVKAINVTFTPSTPAAASGASMNFNVKIDITSVDLLPIQSVDVLFSDSPNAVVSYGDTYQNLPTGTASSVLITGTSGTITVSATTGPGWGSASPGGRTGWGYGYSLTTGWVGWAYHSFGAGIGYGYGTNPYNLPTSITYDISWTAPTAWPTGTYYITLIARGNSDLSIVNNTSFTLTPSSEGTESPPPAGSTSVAPPLTNSAGVFLQDVTASSTDGNVTLKIEQGNKGKTQQGAPITSLSIKPMTSPPDPPAGANVIGLVYDLGPDGATFDDPITLTFTYDPDDLPAGVDEATLVLAVWNEAEGRWDELPSVVDTTNHTITIEIDHFTAFAIIGEVTEAEEPEVEEPEVEEPEVEEPEVEEPEVEEPEVEEPEVEVPEEEEPEAGANWWLIGGIIVAVIVIGGAVWVIFRRRS